VDHELLLRLHGLQSVRRLLPFFWRYKVGFGLAIVFLAVSALASLAIPSVLGRVIDRGLLTEDSGVVGRYAGLILLLGAATAVANGARLYFVSIVGERLIADLRSAIFSHLIVMDTRFFDRHRVGELTVLLTNDVGAIRGAVGVTSSIALRSAITIAGAFVLMLITSPIMTLAAAVAGPALLLPMLAFSRRIRGLSRRSRDAVAELSAIATETLAANRTVKSFLQEPVQIEAYRLKGQVSLEVEAGRLLARSVLMALITFVGTASLVFILWWGSRQVFAGTISAGQLTQFLAYGLMAAAALTNLSEVLGSFQAVLGSTERLVEVLDTQPDIRSPARPAPMPSPPLGVLRLDDVSFGYGADDDEAVLRNVSFAVEAGTTTALVGPSGAGKSTIFALLQRFYDVTGGSVAIDGVDVRSADLAVLRSRMALVDQDPVIFAGTIADNIRFGKPNATDAEIVAAARAALVDVFAEEFPKGYATWVGERGVTLSGGQKQRLAIARAILKNAPILLLDEATSALDAQSEHLVQLALKRLRQGRTTLVIAHRLATIRDADTILVVEQGRIVDRGSHDELVQRGGRYADLAKLQFRLSDAMPAELALH
jgi:ATP-binding cassette subfamily B protein